MKKYLLLVCLTAVLGSIQLRAQDAKATLDAASAALGAGNLRSVEFSGRGFDYIFGQPQRPLRLQIGRFEVTGAREGGGEEAAHLQFESSVD